MTRRPAPPAPDLYAKAYVKAALRLITREAVTRTAVRLVAALGGGWERGGWALSRGDCISWRERAGTPGAQRYFHTGSF